jgi:hypothetical protein
MNPHRTALVASLGLLAFVPSESAGQLLDDRPHAGHIALISSPPGALPPLLSRDQFMEKGSPYVIHLRYGLRKSDSTNTHSAAITGEFPVSFGRLSGTLGIQRFDSTTGAIVGLEMQTMMSRGMLTPNPQGMILVLAFKTELGFGTVLEGPLERTVYSGGASVVMSVPFGGELRIVPFVIPGIGFGVESSGGEYAFEPQMMLSGGLALHNPSRLDVTIAAHRTLADEARTVFGIGITWIWLAGRAVVL